jgi:hypothetical protein
VLDQQRSATVGRRLGRAGRRDGSQAGEEWSSHEQERHPEGYVPQTRTPSALRCNVPAITHQLSRQSRYADSETYRSHQDIG